MGSYTDDYHRLMRRHDLSARVPTDELLPVYDAIPTGIFAATMMRRDLDLATKALAEGNLPAMMRIYESLKGYKL